MNGIDFVQTEDKLYLKLAKQVDPATLTVTHLQRVFDDSPLRRYQLLDDAFKSALDIMTTSETRLVHIGYCVSAQIAFTISSDEMEVTAKVVAPWGGDPVTMNQLLKMLREHGITLGIRRQAMDQIVKHTQDGAPGSAIEVVIARGRHALAGDNARFEPLTMDARERVLQPQFINGDRVDMRDLGAIISVEAQTPILRRIPPTQGTPGFTVKGLTIEPMPGQDRQLNPGEGTTYSSEDSNVLIAVRQGLPRIIGNSAHVDEVLTMRKVDATTGHVDYEGSVVISGNVGPGMRIIAGGDITVNGYVDSAFIHAQGNVTITKGVIGQQTDQATHEDTDGPVDHSTQITSHGSIWVSYCQYATLRAAKGVIVDKQLTHCHVVTDGTLCLGGEGKAARGKLIGGVVDTTTHVYAGQLGAPAGTKTRINLRLPKPSADYQERLAALTQELRSEIAALQKLQKATERARSTMHGEELSKFIATMEPKSENHRRNIAVLKIHARELQKQAPERQMIVIHANRVLHSGVIFHSESEVKRIEENRGPSTLILKNGSFSYQYVG